MAKKNFVKSKKPNKLRFSRVGGLSPHKYKPIKGVEPTFHFPPPRRDGLYAFVSGYEDEFLWAWNKQHQKEFEMWGYRRFDYEGELWCHFVEEALKEGVALDVKGSWVKVTYADFVKLFKKIKHQDKISLLKTELYYVKESFRNCPKKLIKKVIHENINTIKDPYKIGLGGYKWVEHLEVFIEAADAGKIR